MMTPHVVYEHFISAGNKQLMAMISGGTAGVPGFVGVTILLHRRLSDPRIRATSKTSDIVLLFLLWLQLALGLATIPLSAQHLDGSMMMKLAEWSQRIVTFRSGGVNLFARRHGTGERNFGHARVCDQRCANVSIALHDVVNAGGCARLVQDFRDFKSAKCRGF